MAELNSRLVTADGASPEKWVAVLHGIYGAGRNWGSVARDLVSERPEWGVVLVDLRQHGDSMGFEGPHTVERTAADLGTLEVPGRVRVILGHSFGGKIALMRAREDEGVEQVWVVDSTPEPREPSGSAWGMLRVLRSMPSSFEDRDAAVSALESAGVSRPIALWMSTNLDWTGEQYVWRIDMDDMEELLRDFFRIDLWDMVEAPREGLELHFIRATESSVLELDVAERIREAGRRTGRVFVHDVLGGHWLNADNPDAVVELVAARLD